MWRRGGAELTLACFACSQPEYNDSSQLLDFRTGDLSIREAASIMRHLHDVLVRIILMIAAAREPIARMTRGVTTAVPLGWVTPTTSLRTTRVRDPDLVIPGVHARLGLVSARVASGLPRFRSGRRQPLHDGPVLLDALDPAMERLFGRRPPADQDVSPPPGERGSLKTTLPARVAAEAARGVVDQILLAPPARGCHGAAKQS